MKERLPGRSLLEVLARAAGAASWPRPAAPAAALIAWGRDLPLAPVVAREPRAAAHG